METGKSYREAVVTNFAKLNDLILKDLNSNKQQTFKSYTKDNVTTYLTNPIRYAKDLQGLSEYMYNASPHYKRLINYFAKMSTLDHYVESYGLDTSKNVNAKTYRTAFNKAVDFVEQINIKHEFKKALVTAWKIDTFYGYEHINNDSYFIQELPYAYCQISGIIDGVYSYSFDFSYFDRNAEQLDYYAKEFKAMYNKYKSGKAGKWQELDFSKTVCIKINENSYYDLPPFVSVIASVFDIEDYKTLKRTSAILENFKFIAEKIPMRNNSDKNNDFSLELDVVTMFHNQMANTIPEEVGIFTTPFDLEVIEFKRDKGAEDSVRESEREFYSSSGTSQLLFNGDKTTTSSLGKSINVDEQEVFMTHRQIERIVNAKMKSELKGNFKFKLVVLDNTIFNREANTDSILKNAQFGMPVKMKLCASLGMTPSSIISNAYLENEVLGLVDMFIPLSSTHTQSANDNKEDNGRPQEKAEDLTEKGENQRENEDNANR